MDKTTDGEGEGTVLAEHLRGWGERKWRDLGVGGAEPLISSHTDS